MEPYRIEVKAVCNMCNLVFDELPKTIEAKCSECNSPHWQLVMIKFAEVDKPS